MGKQEKDRDGISGMGNGKRRGGRMSGLVSVIIKTGREEWGAEPGVEYYTLTIKEIIWKCSDNAGGFQEGENSGAGQKAKV